MSHDGLGEGGVARHRVSLVARARYRFDLLLARGAWPVLAVVGLATVLIVLVSTLILTVAEVAFTPDTDLSAGEAAWQSMLRTIDPGTMASDSGWGPRLLALLVTLSGILLAGTLIGAIAAGIEERLDGLRRGRSLVVESQHVVILGWSERLFVVVEELAKVPGQGTIVVLAERDKTEMEESIGSRVDLRGRRLVCRSGDPTNTRDLSMMSVESSRAIIVLGGEGDGADAEVVTWVLAVSGVSDGANVVPIVAEVQEERTAAALQRVGGDRVHTVVAAEIMPRVAAVALRSKGRSAVLAELTTFSGSEVYLAELPEFENIEFRALVGSFERCSPLGLVTAAGQVELNPPPDRRITRGERVALIAPSRSSIEWSPAPTPPTVRQRAQPAQAGASRTLMIGWSRHAGPMLSELDRRSASGSSLVAVVDLAFVAEGDVVVPETNSLDVEVLFSREPRQHANILDERTFDTIIVLGYRQNTSTAKADGWTLITLVQLSAMLEARDQRPRIIVELLDARHVELARLNGADDYVISDALLSQVMAQLADQPLRRVILRALFDDSGHSLTIEPAAELGLSGRLTYAEIARVSYEQGFLAIGVRHQSETTSSVVLNPARSEFLELGSDDAVIAVG